jgi:hypothetical protein
MQNLFPHIRTSLALFLSLFFVYRWAHNFFFSADNFLSCNLARLLLLFHYVHTQNTSYSIISLLLHSLFFAFILSLFLYNFFLSFILSFVCRCMVVRIFLLVIFYIRNFYIFRSHMNGFSLSYIYFLYFVSATQPLYHIIININSFFLSRWCMSTLLFLYYESHSFLFFCFAIFFYSFDFLFMRLINSR